MEVYAGFFQSELFWMPYEHKVFLSYRRYREWPPWVRQIFLPLFEHWLGEELGEEPAVYADTNIETGHSWPRELAHALACSRVLVPLLSRQYFSSDWCKTEFGVMRTREGQCNLRTDLRPDGLIIPAYIHDGHDFPADVREIQAAQLQEFTNVRMAKNSATEEELSRQLRLWVPDVVAAIRRAPPWNPEWEHLTATQFLKTFRMTIDRQNAPPSLGM